MSPSMIGAVLAIAVLAVCFITPAANAVPTLTAAGIADGFTFTTFATLNPGNTGLGPFGVAVASDGNIIVSNILNNTRYVFQDVDGQTPATALFTQPNSGSGVTAYATAGGQAYGGVNGQFVQFNTNGTVNHVLTGVTTIPSLGMWGNPVNGHIIATSGAGLIDINPLANGGAGSFVVIPSPAGNGDGVTVSPDGTIAYVEQGSINGYLIATGAQVFTASGFPSPDGTGVIVSSNFLNGQIIVNNNNGVIDLLDPVTKTITPILTGATRGDYVSPDTNNGTLFLDYSDIVGRLSCGEGCGIGSAPPPSGVPEPSTMVLLGTGLLLGVGVRSMRKWLN